MWVRPVRIFPGRRNINQPDPGPGAIDPRRPYAATLPAVTGITWLESSGNSFFSSMQVNLREALQPAACTC